MTRGRLLAASIALAALAGCVETTETAADGGASSTGNALEDQARNSCVAATRAETGNPDVSVISSSYSEAGTEVILQVGPTGTWRCIGYSDGSTADVMSTTDEGAL